MLLRPCGVRAEGGRSGQGRITRFWVKAACQTADVLVTGVVSCIWCPLACGVALLLPSCCTVEVSLQLVMLLVRHVGHPCVGVTFAFQRRVSSSSSNAGSFTRDLFLQILLGEEPGAHTLSCSSTKALLYCDVCILYSSARLFGPHNRRTTLLRTRVLCFLFVSPRVS